MKIETQPLHPELTAVILEAWDDFGHDICNVFGDVPHPEAIRDTFESVGVEAPYPYTSEDMLSLITTLNLRR